MTRHRSEPYERYAFEASPWTQDFTQRDLANLLGVKKQHLEAIVRDKERYIKREQKKVGSKLRDLAIPTRKLRTIHERLKFHLNKIKQPDYLFSPRKGRGQRDNAEYHVEQIQFLSVDIRQFYPSTSDEHIFRWVHHVAGLRADVAGLFTKLVAIDRKLPFGSPVSPVLATQVHRGMFDEIKVICDSRGLKMSLWVDDLVISGASIHGDLVEEVRSVIRERGLQTHKIKFRSAPRRPVIITGVPIQNGRVAAPQAVHKRVHDGYSELRRAQTDLERDQIITRLLGDLGTYRYHLGSSTPEGRKTSNRMEALRNRRARLNTSIITQPSHPIAQPDETGEASMIELPWE